MKINKNTLKSIVSQYNYLKEDDDSKLLEGYIMALKTMDVWSDVQYILYYNSLDIVKQIMLDGLKSLIEKAGHKFDITLLDEYYDNADYYNLPEDERKAIKGKINYILTRE